MVRGSDSICVDRATDFLVRNWIFGFAVISAVVAVRCLVRFESVCVHTMAAGYRISPADMEAARLVFVMLKDVRPMRKVAIPIMDGMSWATFTGQVPVLVSVRGPRRLAMPLGLLILL
jgi:hypothetical protein